MIYSILGIMVSTNYLVQNKKCYLNIIQQQTQLVSVTFQLMDKMARV